MVTFIRFRPLFAAVVLAGLFVAPPAARPEPIEVRSVAVPLVVAEPGQTRVGALTYLGGIRLNSPHPDFGGWSGLWVSPETERLVAVGDRGHWLTADIRYTDDGRLRGVSGAHLIPMLTPDGVAIEPPWADAESIAAVGGGFLVAFERAHRFWWYPATTPEALPSAKAELFFHPQAMHHAPTNGGVEALTPLAPDSGTLLAFAEELPGPGGALGWIFDGDGNEDPITLVAEGGYVPTGATTLANGDVLVLLRRFDLLGFRSRIRLLARSDLVAGGVAQSTLVATLSRPLVSDNFEGIAAVETPGGTLVYLLSDNNFTALQRTLLLMFRLDH